jgi:hypothetical protein
MSSKASRRRSRWNIDQAGLRQRRRGGRRAHYDAACMQVLQSAGAAQQRGQAARTRRAVAQAAHSSCSALIMQLRSEVKLSLLQPLDLAILQSVVPAGASMQQEGRARCRRGRQRGWTDDDDDDAQ